MLTSPVKRAFFLNRCIRCAIACFPFFFFPFFPLQNKRLSFTFTYLDELVFSSLTIYSFVNYEQDETVGDVNVCVKGGFLRYPDSNVV